VKEESATLRFMVPPLLGANGLVIAAEIFAVIALVVGVAWFGDPAITDLILIALGLMIAALHIVCLKSVATRAPKEMAKIGLLLGLLLPGLAFCGAVFLVSV
jgi:hypothetical protein